MKLLKYNEKPYKLITAMFDFDVHTICYVSGTRTGKTFIFFALACDYFGYLRF